MSGGHYTACCLNETSGWWFYFNDDHTTLLRGVEWNPEAVYLAFFQRVHDDATATQASAPETPKAKSETKEEEGEPSCPAKGETPKE